MNYNVNFERFPPEYFSGSNIHIFFENIYIDEIVNLQFNLTEKIRPIYGYNSYTYDDVMRGSRIIQGSFSINFKKANYIRDAVETIIDAPAEDINNFPKLSKNEIEQKKNDLYNVASEGWSRQFDELSDEFRRTMWEQVESEVSAVDSERPFFDFDGSFNIFVKYGPYDSPQRPRYKNEQLYLDHISNGTIIKLLGIEINSVTQAIDISGRPIAENYTFMAKDMSRGQK